MSNKNYLDNNAFEKVLKLYQEDPKAYEDELIKMLDILIETILNTFKFKVDREDAKQECFLLILRVIKNFKPKEGTAFNYFTTIIINNLKLVYTKDKKHAIKIEKYIEEFKLKNPEALL
jgi:DNA-directed RNA polymerase specialized sigma subunit